MWSLAVAMPVVQPTSASAVRHLFAYTLNMLGFFAGGVWWAGWSIGAALSSPDREPVGLAAGFALATLTSSLILFAAAQVLIASARPPPSRRWWPTSRTGSRSAVASPSPSRPPATISRRPVAPIVELIIRDHGWRTMYLSAAGFCLVTMLPLALALKRRPPDHQETAIAKVVRRSQAALGLSPNALQALIALMASAVVSPCRCRRSNRRLLRRPGLWRGARCGDAVADAGFGIVSRVGSGWVPTRWAAS